MKAKYGSSMKALVYHGPGKKAWETDPMPQIERPHDVILKVTQTTICGTDLHILQGHVPTVTDGRIIGHEAVGIVEECGPGVRKFKKGDLVMASCITSCGRCEYCKRLLYSHCVTGGWILGHTINGVQAEYVRIQHADTSMFHVPVGEDPAAMVMLVDILPTGLEIGVQNGQVAPGKTVAIVGAGPVGMSALLTARFYSPSRLIMIDLDDNRLEMAKKFGATDVINSGDGKAAEKVMALTKGVGVDVAMEAVGYPATFHLCQDIVAPGGNIANIGVHGKPVDLHAERLWIQNVNISMGLVNTNSIPVLLKMVEAKQLDPSVLITHQFKLSEIMDAYEVFTNAAEHKSLKVILNA
jgi:alcohol dehydrogenase